MRRARLASAVAAALAEIDATAPIVLPDTVSLVAIGAEPATEIFDAILRKVVRAYPHGGNRLEAALRVAVRLSWIARDAFADAIMNRPESPSLIVQSAGLDGDVS